MDRWWKRRDGQKFKEIDKIKQAIKIKKWVKSRIRMLDRMEDFFDITIQGLGEYTKSPKNDWLRKPVTTISIDLTRGWIEK